jgi:peptidoglycan hydrolase CwlO-like protein
MANEKNSTAMVPVLIAVIGLVGSLGGAWITTGSKFESELKDNQASVKSLQADLDEVKKQLTGKIDEANKQLAEMRTLLESAKKENVALQDRIKDLNTQIEKANKTVAEANEADRKLTVRTEAALRAIDPNAMKKMAPRQ